VFVRNPSTDIELMSSCSHFTASELRLAPRGKERRLRRKFIINQSFECCCFQSKV